MKSVHVLLFVLLPVMLKAADDEVKLQIVDRSGVVHELRNEEDYLNIPVHYLRDLRMAAMVKNGEVAEEKQAKVRMQIVDRNGVVRTLLDERDYLKVPDQHLQMAARLMGLRERRVHKVAEEENLADIEMDELSEAIESLESERDEERKEWAKNHESKEICCQIVCPLLTGVITWGITECFNVFNIQALSGFAASGVGFVAWRRSIEYLEADFESQSEKMAQIKRLKNELESRKITAQMKRLQLGLKYSRGNKNYEYYGSD